MEQQLLYSPSPKETGSKNQSKESFKVEMKEVLKLKRAV